MNLQLIPKPEEPAQKPGLDRAYLRLASQIQALVVQGEFAVGQRLPAERALAERFDVSRTSLREAIIALELQGVVEVRGGSGIYVCEPKPGVARLPMAQEPGAGPFELLRARCLIESEIAGLAATTRKDADLDRMFEALSTMREQMMDKVANEEADRRFHLYIAQSTGNSVLQATVASMWDRRAAPSGKNRAALPHAGIAPGLAGRPSTHLRRAGGGRWRRARLAMRGHLERVIGEFAQGGADADPRRDPTTWPHEAALAGGPGTSREDTLPAGIGPIKTRRQDMQRQGSGAWRRWAAAALLAAASAAGAQEAPAPGQSPRVDAIRKVGELRVGVLQNAPWLIQDVSGKTGEAWSGPPAAGQGVCAAPGREADAGARVA